MILPGVHMGLIDCAWLQGHKVLSHSSTCNNELHGENRKATAAQMAGLSTQICMFPGGELPWQHC